MPHKPTTITLDHLRSYCDTSTGCWILGGATNSIGYPIIKNGQRGCLLARREAARLSGMELTPRQPVATTCGHRLCINPEHLQQSTFQAIAKAAALRGAYSTQPRAKAIAEHKRTKGAKLTLEQARAIRASPESGPVLAERYGVNRTLINAIKRGEAWIDYDDPQAFALMKLKNLRIRLVHTANAIERAKNSNQESQHP
jgi:hypothetical protein